MLEVLEHLVKLQDYIELKLFICGWHRLQIKLNDSKTEVLHLKSRFAKNIASLDINIGDTTISPFSGIRCQNDTVLAVDSKDILVY